MSDNKSVFIVGLDTMIGRMFTKHGFKLVSIMEEADLVQFTGGSDVDPRLYNEYSHPKTHFSPTRDADEMFIFNSALANNIPMAGICRGAQFLNVMNGGSLWQDVDNHTRSHKAYKTDMLCPPVMPEPIVVTSTHHQMMKPPEDSRATILLRAAETTYREYMSELDDSNYICTRYSPRSYGDLLDIEAVFFPDTKCLCFQPHPEFEPCKETTDTYFEFLANYIFG